MHPLVNIGISAARAAGNIMMRHLDRVDQLKIDRKGRYDFVSDVDHRAEQAIIETIHRAYPDHAILGEESGEHGEHEVQWIIDPLDGTTNYLHQIPHFCTSIGIVDRGELAHAIVYDPFKEELFTASKGRGAQLNRRRIRVSGARRLDQALITTGEPLDEGPRMDRYLPQLERVTKGGGGIRRSGSAALDLAYVAAGRYDGFWELNLKPWDIAAGILLVREAGGAVQELAGGDPLKSGDIAAANTRLIEPLMAAIAG
ncbi:inositol-1-monophosphatase [Oceanococcus atlanticus]|uniref:Inositol-1-monophosphatase n=1 Tax=Oceanococcus atlanticus TaxID=1317117 RepID=A0A1Y1SF93_9GAMM|nr:inositol monophosphatase family protein [Oceanococcus atlanticus]ORE88332.1 inositol-1-monophosphatase [Oceanococcus atlanticus]